MTDPLLLAAIDDFMTRRLEHIPFKRAGCAVSELSNPDAASLRCRTASHAFYQLLLWTHAPDVVSSAIDPATTTEGITTIEALWRGHEDLPHMAVLFNGTVIDWTARQFAPSTPWPLIETLKDYSARCVAIEDSITRRQISASGKEQA